MRLSHDRPRDCAQSWEGWPEQVPSLPLERPKEASRPVGHSVSIVPSQCGRLRHAAGAGALGHEPRPPRRPAAARPTLQGVHPPGAGRSALARIIDGKRVMPDDLGLFLDGSWRLHLDLSAYTSEVSTRGACTRIPVASGSTWRACRPVRYRHPIRASRAQRPVERVTRGSRGAGRPRPCLARR